MFGLAMFLFLLLLASQVLLHLYAVSIVTSVAFDTARQVAAHGEDCGDDGANADAIARQRLGAYGPDASMSVHCSEDGAMTVVTIQARTPARALATASFGLGLADIERTASVRTEQVQPADEPRLADEPQSSGGVGPAGGVEP